MQGMPAEMMQMTQMMQRMHSGAMSRMALMGGPEAQSATSKGTLPSSKPSLRSPSHSRRRGTSSPTHSALTPRRSPLLQIR
jgi:hypothetical protein